MRKRIGLAAFVAAIAVLMIVPGGLAAPVGSLAPAPHGPQSLASDPAGFPPANYTNPTISPPPAVPDTTPVVLALSSYGTVAIPNGVWETVVMNYTGYTAGTAYDYFQTVTIDGAMVYVGVNPEAGAWTQFVNLSAYLAFFDHQSTISISGPHLGQGTNFEGVQTNNITLLFYPVPAGASPPSYPTMVEPLFAFAGTPSSRTVTIPSNASAVVLQMIAIGSEFWYSLNPDFTAVTTSIGGYNVSTYLQYPWINSGGIDLFSWRPIFPVHMLDHQWESFNLTGALGLIEGTSTLTVAPASNAMGASVIANLLVYTSPHVKGAVSTGYHFVQHPVQTTTVVNSSLVNVNGNDFVYYNQTDRIDYGYSSTLRTDTGSYSVALGTSESFANHQSLTPVWQNITESEHVNTHQVTFYHERGLHGIAVVDQTLSYPLAMQIGETLVYTSTEGSLSFYNYTSYFYNVTQGYVEHDTTFSDLNGRIATSFDRINDRIYGTNGYFLSVLEFGPGFAIILNVTASLHVTHKVDTQVSGSTSRGRSTFSYYQRRISGLEDNSTTYYVQETITHDRTTVITRTYENHDGFGRDR